MSLVRSVGILTMCLAVILAPSGGGAQPVGKTARVGWLAAAPGQRGIPTPEFLDAFRQGMREKGWIEGQNLIIEARFGTRDDARELAAQLVRAKVDVLVTQGPMVFGARAEAGTIPVVFGFSGDPVEANLVTSFARPGGNLTGIALQSTELIGKRFEVLKEVLPWLTRLAIMSNPGHAGEQSEIRESRAAASRLGLSIQYLPVSSARDFDAAFEAMVRERADAIVAYPDGFIMTQAKAIAEFAERRRIPATSGWAEFAVAGNLMTYGPNLKESWRHVATFADKILRGAKPADLPVEQPTRFELVLNLKAAKALGLTFPPSVLARADRLIE